MRPGPWSISTTKTRPPDLIRNLLDRLPDPHVADTKLKFAPLPGKPAKERYAVVKPIPPYSGAE